MSSHASNYYRETAIDPLSCAGLTGQEEADVCIVGAGLAGLTAGLVLARAGRRVVILEAEVIAWGASGCNGGVVSPGFATSHAKIAARTSEQAANALHRLSIEGVEIVRKNIQALKLESACLTPGTLKVSRYDNAREVQENIRWLHDTFQYELEYLPREKVRSLLESRKYFHAAHDPQAFHFHPLNYATGLAREFLRLGGRIFEHSRALALTRSGAERVVKTSQGSVRARDVLVTCGGYTDHLVPRLAASYVPILTYMIVTQRAPERIAGAIRTRWSIGDSRRASDYYRLVDGGERILWGGMITTRQSEPADLAKLLQARMVDTYPSLAGLGVDLSWSGRMAYARHLMPQIGRLEDGLWYCTSFGGHGMNTTAIGGTVAAEAILGESTRYQAFAPFGLSWNGGSLGRLAVQLTYWTFQIKDHLQERAAAKSG